MKQSQKQKQICVIHNEIEYSVQKDAEGWLKVTGGEEFKYKPTSDSEWSFSKPVDYDLQVKLQNEAIKEQLL
ncbi:hypothetical protein BH10BAC2_BH10BAC2_35420 [soil metagenome]